MVVRVESARVVLMHQRFRAGGPNVDATGFRSAGYFPASELVDLILQVAAQLADRRPTHAVKSQHYQSVPLMRLSIKIAYRYEGPRSA